MEAIYMGQAIMNWHYYTLGEGKAAAQDELPRISTSEACWELCFISEPKVITCPYKQAYNQAQAIQTSRQKQEEHWVSRDFYS